MTEKYWNVIAEGWFHVIFSDEDKEDSELTDEEKQQKAIDAAIKEIMERFACILVTQPLHVVTVRAMASFVGNEQEYNGILEGLKTIYRENGILGFWSGMMPRALGEALTIAIGAGLTFLLNQYVEPSMKAHTSMIAGKFCIHSVKNCDFLCYSDYYVKFFTKQLSFLAISESQKLWVCSFRVSEFLFLLNLSSDKIQIFTKTKRQRCSNC